MKNYAAQNVDDYIAHAPEGARPNLNEIRRIILSAVPGAQEAISWGIPFYRYHGLLAGFAAFKNHVGFGFCDPIGRAVQEELRTLGYSSGKKTIQIPIGGRAPETIIRRILTEKASYNESNRKT